MVRRIAIAGILACGALTVLSSTTLADTTTLSLGDPNSAISGFTGPYATVTINLTSSTTATISFTSLTNSGDIFLMGDGGAVALNVNASSFALGTITESNSGTGFTPSFLSSGAGFEDGFGTFDLTINNFGGFTDSADAITLTLTNTSGTWGSASDVLTANASGFSAAAHVFVTASPANASNGALTSGFAANGTPTATPEPSSLLLLGLGVLAMSFSCKRALRRVKENAP